ncbi:MAG: hypothetical protein A3C82_02550 [Candidatus Wildermuthbacteria bacterium RIFCSPHIGHO2_02_FULL_47_12]|uniref:TrpR like protein, YerC/YecD n=1 Tax=Candidatus Wildermuthbacteria bacterium RIFCSPHIGHO2_02_FULL_47_12 TaxID=1802451 RepID=A0A1G2R3F8_9BACT|nr:MAG: hypothetical protein A3C82_02550 [Candidatus Wildermuthbacteria bacterium RIFCSPHIGHO2_02_FULL_47_12]
MPYNERQQLLGELWSSVALLKTREEIKNFFRDLLSETEELMLARRIHIARLLLEGKSYEYIRENMHTSYVTIAGVHRWLHRGSERYKGMLKGIEEELKKQSRIKEKRRNQRTPFTFEWLKKRYPLHFLLFNLLDRS